MGKEKTIGIKVFGWCFIAYSFLLLIKLPKIISSYYNLCSSMVGLAENMNFMPEITAYSIFATSVVFFIFLITGIGILKLKRWAYYAAIVIPFIFFLGIIKNIWLFGPQSIMRPWLFSALFISVTILFFLMRKSTIGQFNADYVTKKGKKLNPRKFILWASIILVLVNVFAIASWFLCVNFGFKGQLPIVNLRPQKVEYGIQDESFILNNCEKRNVFDYSIYIPKNLKIGIISMGDSGFGWNLGFINIDNSKPKAFIMLDSKGLGRALLPISKALNFSTVYDFEKTINYPNWTPIYFILKTVGSQNLTGIDEATSPTWRGFVRVAKTKEKNLYDCSLYSLKGNRTCSVALFFKDGVMVPGQAKSIIASLEFKDVDSKSEFVFEKAKSDLSKGDFTSATINFMNALYINDRNLEYAYYLARSLFEDADATGRKTRLSSSKRFLEYALKLNPDYSKAKELLVLVNKEIQKAGQKKKIMPH